MLPPIKIVEKTSGNASNNPLGIKIESKATPFAAILCQEHYEWWVKIWFFAALFVPVLLFKIPALNRWLELRGHAIECAVAFHYYGINKQWYIEKEASDMLAGYSGLFSKYSKGELIDKLQRLQPFATEWVENRFELIEKYASMDPKRKTL